MDHLVVPCDRRQLIIQTMITRLQGDYPFVNKMSFVLNSFCRLLNTYFQTQYTIVLLFRQWIYGNHVCDKLPIYNYYVYRSNDHQFLLLRIKFALHIYYKCIHFTNSVYSVKILCIPNFLSWSKLLSELSHLLGKFRDLLQPYLPMSW